MCNPQVKQDVTVNTTNSRLTVKSGNAKPLTFSLSNHPPFSSIKTTKKTRTTFKGLWSNSW